MILGRLTRISSGRTLATVGDAPLGNQKDNKQTNGKYFFPRLILMILKFITGHTGNVIKLKFITYFNGEK